MASSSGLLDETGARYGRLTVLARGSQDAARAYKWLCRCDCGVEKEVNGAHMRAGRIRSCGCLGADKRRAATVTHGLSGTRTYRSWNAMLGRCYQPGNASYPAYGAKGVSVCTRWRESFEAFLADMGERPEGTSLDRIDAAGNYEPGNCRWASAVEQQANRRVTVKITAFGETKPLAQWAREAGISQAALRARLARGWSPEGAVSRKLMKAIHGIEVRLT